MTLCDESNARVIGSFFVPLFLTLSESRRRVALQVPSYPNDEGHAHFVYILPPDGRVIRMRSPGGNELDNPVAFRKALQTIIARLHLTPSAPLPARPFPARNAALTLRIVSRYASQLAVGRHHLDLDTEDLRSILPPEGLENGGYVIPFATARKILVAMRPVATPHPQRFMQTETDASASARVEAATLNAAIGPGDLRTITVTLQGALTLTAIPGREVTDHHWGDPRGLIGRARVTVSGYLRFDRKTRHIEAFDLITQEGTFTYGRTNTLSTYQACARLDSDPPPR